MRFGQRALEAGRSRAAWGQPPGWSRADYHHVSHATSSVVLDAGRHSSPRQTGLAILFMTCLRPPRERQKGAQHSIEIASRSFGDACCSADGKPRRVGGDVPVEIEENVDQKGAARDSRTELDDSRFVSRSPSQISKREAEEKRDPRQDQDTAHQTRLDQSLDVIVVGVAPTQVGWKTPDFGINRLEAAQARARPGMLF